MRKVIFTIVFLVFSLNTYSQENKKMFSDEIKKHIRKFNNSSDYAYSKGEIEKGQALFDSLVKNYLVGTKIEDYSFKRVNGKKVKLNKLDKPVLIITYASWCVMNKAEIPALNFIAKQYANDFDLIILFWDKKSNIAKLASKFNSNVKVCYANENYSKDEEIVSTLKHYLGFPMSYFINKELQIIDIQRGSPQIPLRTPFKKALEINTVFFQKRISNFLIEKEIKSEPYVKTEN